MPKPKSNKKLNLDNKFLVICASILILGLLAGIFLGKQIFQENKYVRVWAADETVNVPDDLKSYLETESKDDCKSYAGDDSPRAPALYAVTKVVDDNYAKMAWGCADSLTNDIGIVALKRDGKWNLIQPSDYYQTESNPVTTDEMGGITLPKCSELQKYNISKNAEPECFDPKDKVKQNPND